MVLNKQEYGGKQREKKRRVETDYIPILRYINEIHKFITLTADVMFVNSIQFLTTISRDIRFLTAKHFTSCTDNQPSISLIKATKLYARRSFIVCVILLDMKFEKVSDEVGLVEGNTTAAQYNIREIERGIITTKEHALITIYELSL